MKFSRADRSRLAEWWFTVDHVLLYAILIIVAAGVVLSLAASPAVAVKKGLSPYYFVERHVIFSLAGIVIMLAVSLLGPAAVRRLAILTLAASMIGLVAVYFMGEEINGARRWLSIEGHSIQPSEFAKPAFVVVSGWLLAEARRRPDMPALTLAMSLFAIFAGLLVIQPDVGQTMLVTMVWMTMLFVSGLAATGAAVVAVAGAVGLYGAYIYFPHVAFRIDRFINPQTGDFSQGDRAIRSFVEGGFLGRGPGEGTIKTSLPDAHTDYIFAVVAEEYGALACLALLCLFAFVVLRALRHAESEPDAATRLGIVGLSLMFGLQALINMGVNVGLLPAKGMTLPFLSAGGSSMLAISLTLGMLLALTRRRPDADRLKKPPLMPSLPSLAPNNETRT
ncbi:MULTISPECIES: FtsW/RodA/SpoVE family cell cycle protein [Hyphomicrobium]|jgi:cell division protein FtsW|uniref:FtsW/RodA/SpoVE family cell cycle protein n=1 Tax=Hyphomicrobium TaxID=81 RepID=UPI00037907A3|nr:MULTISPECIES: putative peptidoglycan glycosyltransferase FtsW [Hyphomicrobium]WBT37623.1 putative peptidoglycan glycosyltransferase FtsW [Hyphomicrobium sp. DMF-1]HML43871.1 putative peptidoglycan glycosyltransferase FtsW [Hyphomicrobium zavarzinii]